MVIAVLGTGAIGSAVTRTLLRAEHDVVVWNRTPARTAPLVADGCRTEAEPGSTVAGAQLVLVCVTDPRAGVAVIEDLPARGRTGADTPGDDEATIVTMLTSSPTDARRLAAAATERGYRFLAAGVQSAPEAVGTTDATFVYGGDAVLLDHHRPVLELLGSVRWAGASSDSAAVWDQALFGLWYDAHLGLLRALDLVRAAGGDVEGFGPAALRQLEATAAGTLATVAEVRDGEAPRGPASLAEHLPLLRDLVEARRDSHLGDGGLEDVVALVERRVDEGGAGAGLTDIVTER